MGSKLGRVDRHRLGAVVCLVDANEPVGQLEHVVTKGDDDELGILGPLLDVVGDDADVLEVKSCVDLVHDVERRGLVVWCRWQRGGGGGGIQLEKE